MPSARPPEGDANLREHEGIGVALGALIFTAALINPLAFTGLYAVLPAINGHFSEVNNSAALVRGLITIVSVALVLGAPIAGYTVERFGIRSVLFTAISIFTAAGLSGFIIDDLWVLLASRLLLGLADAFIGTVVIALIASRFDPARRNRWIGWYAFASAMGALIFIPLSGWLAEFDWRYVFLLYGLGVPIFISAALALKREERSPRAAVATRPSTAIYFPVALIALGIASGAVENTTHLFLPFHLQQMGESSPSRIALAVLPIAIGGAISAFLYGQVRDFLSIGRVFLVAFMMGGFALIWLGLTDSYVMILLAAAFLGLGVGLLAPNIHAYAAVFGDPAHQARDIGFARGAFFAGAPIAQLMLEPISGVAGGGGAIIALGCASFLLMLWPLISRPLRIAI